MSTPWSFCISNKNLRFSDFTESFHWIHLHRLDLIYLTKKNLILQIWPCPVYSYTYKKDDFFLINVSSPTVIQMSSANTIRMVLGSSHIIQVEYQQTFIFSKFSDLKQRKKMLAMKTSEVFWHRRGHSYHNSHIYYLLLYDVPFDRNANSASFRLYAKLKWESLFLALTRKLEKRMCTVWFQHYSPWKWSRWSTSYQEWNDMREN